MSHSVFSISGGCLTCLCPGPMILYSFNGCGLFGVINSSYLLILFDAGIFKVGYLLNILNNVAINKTTVVKNQGFENLSRTLVN